LLLRGKCVKSKSKNPRITIISLAGLKFVTELIDVANALIRRPESGVRQACASSENLEVLSSDTID